MGKVLRMPIRYNKLFDIFMLIITLGLWTIRMITRPKYY